MCTMRKLLVAAFAAFALVAPLTALAQDMPSYAQPYNQANGDQQIRGRVTAFNGAYSLQVRDDRGFIDNVQLHQGTVINPTGLTLAPGMIVSILGYNAGPFFAANEIDTPYLYYGGVPYYGGHPWFYYGPSVSLGFFFGNRGWWHGGYFGDDDDGYVGHGYYYTHAPVRNVYTNGRFQGRNYVVPPARGGYVPNRGHVDNRGGGDRRGGGGDHRGGGGDHRGGGGR
jgi:uncharacterized membrane protein YgcG